MFAFDTLRLCDLWYKFLIVNMLLGWHYIYGNYEILKLLSSEKRLVSVTWVRGLVDRRSGVRYGTLLFLLRIYKRSLLLLCKIY
jgi:hypothetical protein